MDHDARLTRPLPPKRGKVGRAVLDGAVVADAPIRVLFIHYGGSSIRGSESVLLELLRLIDRDRITPYLACNQPWLAETAGQLAVESFLLDRPTIGIDGRATRIEPVRWYRTVQTLRRLAQSLGVGLLYCQNGQPVQVAYYASRRLEIPCVAHIHAFYNRRDIHLMRLGRVSSLIFVSDAVRQHIYERTRLKGTSHVIHNGVDLERFSPTTSPGARSEARKRWGVPKERVVVGQVGSLIHGKGVDVLLGATKELIDQGRPIHLVLVGSGQGKPSYRRQAEQLGIEDHVTFTGNLIEPSAFYRHVFDINVLASRQEAFGLALIEGAASGLPLIAARTGGMKEVVREGVSGMLFAPADKDGLISCLRRLIDDRELRLAMGREARLQAEREFSLNTQVKRIGEVISGFAAY